MVSLITAGSATNPKGEPWPLRRPTPYYIVVGVLAVAALIAWIVVWPKSESGPSTDCGQPPAGENVPAQWVKASREQMLKAEPAALADVRVRVLNANGADQQASRVSGELNGLGFRSTADNDSVYTEHKMSCFAQIRFGPSGQKQAASVWLTVPCAELIRDERDNDSIDLALGTGFHTLNHNASSRSVLQALRKGDPVDPNTISALHTPTC
ncbi:MAG: envelope integrity protein Cei [Segniliparus sp.]|uniref:envelope integrity protein Cei n=1 Tax=Segniliparus sp. TaxID=2804064 RepID=UPI003F337AC6